MTTKLVPRLLSEIAVDILAEIDTPRVRKAIPYVEALKDMGYITNKFDYATVVTARQALGPWRSIVAKPVKMELDTILAHYRVDCE